MARTNLSALLVLDAVYNPTNDGEKRNDLGFGRTPSSVGPIERIRLFRRGRILCDDCRVPAGMFVWHGHNYAYEPARALNLPIDEGVVRVGLAHYNTESEVERTLEEISKTVTQAG